MKRFRVRTAVVATAAALTLFALTQVAEGATTARSIRVIKSSGTAWRPATVSVSRGTTVKWVSTGLTHTVSSYKGPWRKNVTISSGQSTTFKFRKAGTYFFRCKFHSSLSNGKCVGMCGKVIVTKRQRIGRYRSSS